VALAPCGTEAVLGGHPEEIWLHPCFQQIALAGIHWSLGNVEADVTPNFDEVTPGGNQYQKVPLEPGTMMR
jgi:hypothetical protein